MLINKFFLRFYFDKDDTAGTNGTDEKSDDTQADAAQLGKDGKPFDPARAQATIDALRVKERAYDKLVKADEARKLAEMTESDRAKAEKTSLETKLAEVQGKMKATLASASVIKAAAKAGFNDPDDAWNLLKERLTVSDDGEVDGLETALSALVTSKPYLVKAGAGNGAGSAATPPANGGKQTSPGNPGVKPGLSKAALESMTPEEIAKHWNDSEFQKQVEAALKSS